MTIHETVKAQMKDAMIKKETVRLSVLRGLIAAFTSELIAKKSAEALISDDDATAVIKRSVKQRKDSIDQFTKGGRADLADAEKEELAVLETFLPQMMSREEIEKIAKAKMAEMGGTIDKAKLGQFVGAVMKECKGKADGSLVKEVVESMVK